MLAARIMGERVVVAEEVSKENGPFHCPECRTNLILKKGQVKVHHFAHESLTNCSLSAPESPEHMRLKMKIYKDAILAGFEAELEKSFENHRTDCFVKTNKGMYAFEVQLSAISEDDIVDRINTYRKLNINTIWIVADKYSEDTEYKVASWIKFLHKIHFGALFTYHQNLKVIRLKLHGVQRYNEGFDSYSGDYDRAGYYYYPKTIRTVTKDFLNPIHVDDLSVSYNKNVELRVCTLKYIPSR